MSFNGFIGMSNDRINQLDNNARSPSCNLGGSTVFIFKIDNKVVYESKLLTGKDAAEHVKFNIPLNSEILSITFDPAESAACDHPVIGDPKLSLTTKNEDTGESMLDLSEDDEEEETTENDNEREIQISVDFEKSITTLWSAIKKQR